MSRYNAVVAPSRDDLELIWSIAELSSLLERRTNVDTFLQDVVERIAEHRGSDACSIYLYDESMQLLTMRATVGLAPTSVGSVTLALGEGITGTALKELRPTREAHATSNPNFKHIRDIGEEAFESFLAVPIRRGLTRVGAIVLQQRKAGHFTDRDTRAVQAIAAQLATTLENVEILMEIRGGGDGHRSSVAGPVDLIHGSSASGGLAEGRAVILGNRGDRMAPDERVAYRGVRSGVPADLPGEVQRFRNALEQAQSQLEALHREMDRRLPDVASLIFSAHVLMLRDEEFSGRMARSIEEGSSAEQAVISIVNHYVRVFSENPNPRIKEKSGDVKDLGHRLMRNLSGSGEEQGDYSGQIVIAYELFPSELVKIAAQEAEGLIITGGGATAHLSILARSLELPMVFVTDPRVREVQEGTQVLLDAAGGHIYINPQPRILERYHNRDAGTERPNRKPKPETTTSDGVRVRIMANVNLIHDVELARESEAEGIGLYRSEFPFIVRNGFPTEEEQYTIYRSIIERMGERPVVLRTLDIGGDKLFTQGEMVESNPFLGLRGIRFSLENDDVFREQIRAMLRAGHDADLGVLFPMIASLDELLQAKAIVQECIDDLADRKVRHNGKPKIGVMIEVPSAVECADDLASSCDFLSLGTNDLVMYLLAVDRTNALVADLYTALHPSVLRAIKRSADAALARKKEISVCGEVGGDPTMIAFLIGCGVTTISAEPAKVPAVKEWVSELDAVRCRLLAKEMLSRRSVAELADFLSLDVSKLHPGQPLATARSRR